MPGCFVGNGWGTSPQSVLRGRVSKIVRGLTAPGDGDPPTDWGSSGLRQVEQQMKLYTDALKLQV